MLAAGRGLTRHKMTELTAVPVSSEMEKGRSQSPQPSTSAGLPRTGLCPHAVCPPAAAPTANRKSKADSVYSHVTQNISNIPQLRGLKAGRRHGRLRRLHSQNKIELRYGDAIRYIGPLLGEEMARQQGQHVLIASALDHFANTINQIADKLEGKTNTDLEQRLAALKQRMLDRREQRRLLNPDAPEFAPRAQPPPRPTLSQEEINKRLREETEAAVEALLTGDKSKEVLPDNVAPLIEFFKAASS